MSEASPPFRYGPDALLEQTRWEAQLLAADTARAQRLLEAQRTALRRTREAIGQGEDALRALYTDAVGISLGRRALVQDYLDQQRGIEARQRQEVDLAEARYEQIFTQLHAKRLSMEVMEAHRERKRLAHAQAAASRAWRRADDAWLLAGGARAARTSLVPARVLAFAARKERMRRTVTAPARFIALHGEGGDRVAAVPAGGDPDR